MLKGPQSFKDLRTYHGIIYNTFEEATVARGILFSDSEWERILEEAVSIQNPSQIRNLFSYICAFNQPSKPKELFDKFYDDMIEDLNEDENPKDKSLSVIKEIVNSHGWSMQSLGLPEPQSFTVDGVTVEVDTECVNAAVDTFNNQQKGAFELIIERIDILGGLLYLDGPAGSGKTYLYNVLTEYLHSKGKSTIQLATTGIAADLLENGRTVHSGMKLPAPLTESSVSRLDINSKEAKSIRDSSLILIDEVSMMSKYALNVIDEVLRRIYSFNLIFGGKTVLLGGDFRQTANIVIKGTPRDIIENSIMSSRLWDKVIIISLSTNMRTGNQSEFSEWLLSLGNGILNDNEGLIEIPDEHLEKENLVSSIFGTKRISNVDKSIYSKIILTKKNDCASMINKEVLDLIEGDYRTYSSSDSIVSDDVNEYMRYPIEFLNKQQPSGLPPHKLRLKKGAIVMLLRNLDAKNGLLNGTRIWIKELHNNFLVGEVITGKSKDNIVAVPRIDLAPSDTLLPFVLRRRQFPVMLSFAMTIHKAQGQTFDSVGVYLPEPVFTHGQLYVALSRIRMRSNLKVWLGYDNKTRNIVYNEFLVKK